MGQPYSSDSERLFERHKVKPPEHIPHLSDEDREALLRRNMADHVHTWKQQANDIFCDTGTYRHGFRAKPEVKLVGTDEHTRAPLLEKFTSSDNN